jgi:hypothetical protein
MCHKTTHHSLDRLGGRVPLMFSSNPIIIMGILIYHLNDDAFYSDYV